jgi:hypothetical protein
MANEHPKMNRASQNSTAQLRPCFRPGEKGGVSTESGDGRHNDIKRELSGIFHAVTGANGRIKTGQIMDVGSEGLDVYNTILESMNVADCLGPNNRPLQAVDSIRV